MATYVALIRKDPDSDFGVEFPDFPGCVTAGRTLDEARRMAGEALALHIEGMIEDGDALPDPSSLEEALATAMDRNAAAVLVDGPLSASPAQRINVTLPQDLIEAIDKVAPNRSRFLAEAARARLRA